MFVLVVAGSDKTTISVATGSQEYHPVYGSLGNILNQAHRSHGSGMVPIAFLPIPKSSIKLILVAIYLTLFFNQQPKFSERSQPLRSFVANYITNV